MFLERLRTKIGKNILKSKLKSRQRNRYLYDFSSAQSVGILCSPRTNEEVESLNKLQALLKSLNIKSTVLGFFYSKNKPENLIFTPPNDFFTEKELSFFLIPNAQSVKNFTDTPFDILINFNINTAFPLQFVAEMSLAKFKVAPAQIDSDAFDFTIELSPQQDLNDFTANLKSYLSNLKNPH